jgi:hypothetical protein
MRAAPRFFALVIAAAVAVLPHASQAQIKLCRAGQAGDPQTYVTGIDGGGRLFRSFVAAPSTSAPPAVAVPETINPPNVVRGLDGAVTSRREVNFTDLSFAGIFGQFDNFVYSGRSRLWVIVRRNRLRCPTRAFLRFA